MKKILLCVALSLTLVSGCSKKELTLNIPQWMLGDTITENLCIKGLGAPDDEWDNENEIENAFSLTWNGYELIDGYIGTLQVTNYPDLNAYIWRWSKTATEKEFNTIYATVENYLGEVSGVYEDDKENTSYSFNFIKQDGVFSGDGSQVYYPLTIFYGNDIITVQWGHNGLSFGEASALSSEA